MTEPVTLFRTRSGTFVLPEDAGPWRGQSVEWYRALPEAEFDALVLRDRERKGIIDAALVDRARRMEQRAEQAERERDEARALLEKWLAPFDGLPADRRGTPDAPAVGKAYRSLVVATRAALRASEPAASPPPEPDPCRVCGGGKYLISASLEPNRMRFHRKGCQGDQPPTGGEVARGS